MAGRLRTGTIALALALVACGGPAGSSSQPPAPATPTARLGAVLTADPGHHHLVLFGGRSRDGVLADTWLWTAGTWQRAGRGPAPPARSFAGAAADGHGGVILFGGDPSDPGATHDDTWRWDGSRWTQLHPATVPDGGAYRTMGAGPDGAPLLVVFAADRTVHTWRWAGGNWEQASSAVTPPWLDDAVLVLDQASGRTLLAGGIPEPGTRLDGTWAWDGAGWTLLRTAHQPVGGPAVAADVATGPLLFEQDGTWTWGGGDWTLAQPPGTPPWMAYSALAAIPGAAAGDVLAVLLTGPAGDPGQTWRWNGFGWTQS